MDLLQEILGFAAKGFIVFVTVSLTAAAVVALTRRGRVRAFGPRLEVQPLHRRFEALGDALRSNLLTRKEQRLAHRARRKERAARTAQKRPCVFVLDFEGDLLATPVKSLREEVSAIAAVAGPADEVVVRLESGGGAVAHYGLAAAQLVRLKERKLKVTVCIDRVAASGGYMMACVADVVRAAPFAVIGSIGVVAQVPNVHRLLKKHDVDFDEMTAGEFKRTVSVFAEITDQGREKFQTQLEEVHGLFKEFVRAQRPKLEVDKVSTGEYWLGRRALELGLVDQLGTSDDYLLQRVKDADVYRVHFKPEETMRDRLSRFAADAVDRSVLALLSRLARLELR